jgi:hypothetical protein
MWERLQVQSATSEYHQPRHTNAQSHRHLHRITILYANKTESVDESMPTKLQFR